MTDNDLRGLRVRVEAAQDRAERARAQGDYAGSTIAQGDARRYLRRIITEQRRRANGRTVAA
jgi:hypothetical protein